MFDAGDAPLVDLHIQRKTYWNLDTGHQDVVRNLSLQIHEGEFLCVVGPSGCGKTTILRILLGLDRAYEGRLRLDHAQIRIGTVFQEPRLLSWRTVEENVRLVLPGSARGANLDSLFADVGLQAWRARYPGELSLGLARRVALARALAISPKLLILDEAFLSLDDRAASDLRGLVLARGARDLMAVLLVTHNIREALELADRILFLTHRPAQILGESIIERPREDRCSAWIEAQRNDIVARFDANRP
jgi:NitT/TauT family transport system ATP-binding protein